MVIISTCRPGALTRRLSNLLVLLPLIFAFAAPAAHLQIRAIDFTTAPATNRNITLTLLSVPSINGTNLLVRDPIRRAADTNGNLIVSNLIAGNYDLSLGGTFSTTYKLVVPDTNILLNASDLVTNAIAVTGTWPYDLRYFAEAVGDGVTVDTNAGHLRLTISGGSGPTNGVTGLQATNISSALIGLSNAVVNGNLATVQAAGSNYTYAVSNSLYGAGLTVAASNVLVNLASNYTYGVSNMVGLTVDRSNVLVNLSSNYTWAVSNALSGNTFSIGASNAILNAGSNYTYAVSNSLYANQFSVTSSNAILAVSSNFTWSVSNTLAGGVSAVTNINIFTNIAEMLGSTLATNGSPNYVVGYYGTNGLGGGWFKFSAGSTLGTNYGRIFETPAGRLIRQTDGNSVNLGDYGVRPYGGAGSYYDDARFQDAVWDCLSNKCATTIIVPAGIVSVTNGILIGLPVYSSGVVTNYTSCGPLTIKGGGDAVDATGPVAEIYNGHKTNATFIVQCGRAITFDGLLIYGRNNFSSPGYDSQKWATWTNFVQANISTNRNSPYAGIVFDPFSDQVKTASVTNSSVVMYPSWTNYYETGVDAGNNGSARCTIQNCKIRYFYIAVANGASGVPGSIRNTRQLGESINMLRNNFDLNTITYAPGQGQTKSCTFAYNNVRYTYCAINTGVIGTGGSGFPPHVIGGDWICVGNMYLGGIGIEEAAYIPWGASYIYMEQVYRLGTLSYFQGGAVSFNSCEFVSSEQDGYRVPQFLATYSPVAFNQCIFRNWTSTNIPPLTISHLGSMARVKFNGCHFNFSQSSRANNFPVQSSNPQLIEYDSQCEVVDYYGQSSILGGTITDNTSLFTNLVGKYVQPGTMLKAGTNVYMVQFNPTNSSSTFFWPTGFNTAGQIIGTNTGNKHLQMQTGDPVWSTLNTGYENPDYSTRLSGTYVGSVAVAQSNYIILNACGAWATNTANWTAGWRISVGGPLQRLMWKDYRADLVSGTNMFTMTNASDWNVGQRIRAGKSIPIGTYITNISGNDVYLSQNISSTSSNALIYDAFIVQVGGLGSSVGLMSATNGTGSDLTLYGSNVIAGGMFLGGEYRTNWPAATGSSTNAISDLDGKGTNTTLVNPTVTGTFTLNGTNVANWMDATNIAASVASSGSTNPIVFHPGTLRVTNEITTGGQVYLGNALWVTGAVSSTSGNVSAGATARLGFYNSVGTKKISDASMGIYAYPGYTNTGSLVVSNLTGTNGAFSSGLTVNGVNVSTNRHYLTNLLDVVATDATNTQVLTRAADGNWYPSNVTASSSSTYSPLPNATNVTLTGTNAVCDCAMVSSNNPMFCITLSDNLGVLVQNPIDGMTARWRLKQDATGNRTVALTNLFRFGKGSAAVITGIALSTNANYVDYFKASYNATDGYWDVIGNAGGY